MQLEIARNPDEVSTLTYLQLAPVGDGLVFCAKGTWPRTASLFCYPLPRAAWPDDPDLVES